ncbi:MAG: hypothetical protein K8J08_08240 [Thermoanaerobaculia bacterium]|nr:hypothetical protein [Thermoanaerobaculia bacterium]
MRRPPWIQWLSLLVVGAVALPPVSGAELDAAKAWQDYWSARSSRQAAKDAERLLEAGICVDDALRRLELGRTYSPKVKRGLLRRSHLVAGGLLHHYAIVVPESYRPEVSHAVVVYLHGGVQRAAPNRGERWWPEGLEKAEDGEILILPAGWSESLWWQRSQVENINDILDEVRRTYNVDENRVSLLGVSDGGTGAYFQAFRNTTPWAAFVPLIGHSRVLGNPASRADGEMFPINLSNKPLFVVNGAHDQLYPSWSVAPYLDLFASAGADIEFRHQPEAGHDLSWWSAEADRMDRFLRDHPRDPLPDRLAWETERTDRYERNHWLRITELGKTPDEPDLPGFDLVLQPGSDTETVQAFPHRLPSGRVEVHRRGNTIVTRSRGVRRFHLMLSPRELDLAEPVTVAVNGNVLFQGIVEPDLATLLHWNAIDDDRTMLFVAELSVDVAQRAVTVVDY